jgi:lipoic acid synthetase
MQTPTNTTYSNSSQSIDVQHLKGESKVARLKIEPNPEKQLSKKPSWIRTKQGSSQKVAKLKQTMREANLFSVCEEASCPNLSECFNHGTATFMIMGQICTRRCPFCDVAHGKPLKLDENEPKNLATTIANMHLKYIVLTSVDRDDLRDGGAQHFKDCIDEIKLLSPDITIEVLTPDFRGRMDRALAILKHSVIDVFNHNLETVPSLYPKVRPGAHYQHSLDLLKEFKVQNPTVITKSGIMLGVGETRPQVLQVLQDLRSHNVDMLTLGQYLQPSKHHLKVEEYIHPDIFDEYKHIALDMGFSQVASGPMVRSSYHADLQAQGKI